MGQKFAPDAGGILAKLVNDIKKDSFGKVSLMCHSMGNHLVFNNAGKEEPLDAPDVEFQNIFMVGADVPNDIFSERPTETGAENDYGNKRKKAEKMKEMLAKGGKIYVLHTKIDKALQGSKNAYDYRDDRERLGTTGAIEIRQDFNKNDTKNDTVVNIDVTSLIEGEEQPFERFIDHLYQYDPWAVKLYSDVHSMSGDKFRETYVKKD